MSVVSVSRASNFTCFGCCLEVCRYQWHMVPRVCLDSCLRCRINMLCRPKVNMRVALIFDTNAFGTNLCSWRAKLFIILTVKKVRKKFTTNLTLTFPDFPISSGFESVIRLIIHRHCDWFPPMFQWIYNHKPLPLLCPLMRRIW